MSTFDVIARNVDLYIEALVSVGVDVERVKIALARRWLGFDPGHLGVSLGGVPAPMPVIHGVQKPTDPSAECPCRIGITYAQCEFHRP